MDSILNDMLGRLNETGTKSLTDSVIVNPEKNKNDDTGDVEVIVRKVVKPSATDSSKRKGEVFINAENDEVEEGDEVTVDGDPVEDGIYEYDQDGESVQVAVKDGKVAAIGEEAIEDLLKTVIRGGQVVKKKIRTVKKRLTSAQRAGLVKARKKAHTGAAKMHRLKSFKKGQMKGLHNATDAEDFMDVKKVNLSKLGETLYNSVFGYLTERYSLTEKEIEDLDGELSELVCNPVIDGNSLKVTIPVWSEEKDGEEETVDLSKFDTIELVYDLIGTFDDETLIKGLTEGDLKFQTNLIV